MEKLRLRDRERGEVETQALSPEQKARIAEIRSQARAKIAEMEILWSGRRREIQDDPEALEKAEQQYVADRRRVEERAESEVEKIRKAIKKRKS
jgi:hypothetical protein